MTAGSAVLLALLYLGGSPGAFLSSAVLRPVELNHDIGRVTFGRDIRGFVNEVNETTHFMMMQNFRVENVVIFDTSPNDDCYLVPPSLDQRFNRYRIKAALAGAPRPQYDGRTNMLEMFIKDNLSIFAQRVSFGAEPRSDCKGWSQPHIFPPNVKNILFDFTVENVGRTTELLPEHKGSQLPFSGFLCASHKASCCEPQKECPSSQDKSEECKCNGRSGSDGFWRPINRLEPAKPPANDRHPFPLKPAVVGLLCAAFLSLLAVIFAWLLNK